MNVYALIKLDNFFHSYLIPELMILYVHQC